MKIRELDQITTVVLHCSATDKPDQWGLKPIKELHTAPRTQLFYWGDYPDLIEGKNWSDIGYHAVVNRDGNTELGRPIERQGAGVRNHNSYTLHICMDGLESFEPEQLMGVCEQIKEWETILNRRLIIKGHYELNSNKSCPNYDMNIFRLMYDSYLNGINEIAYDVPRINNRR